MAKAKKKTVKRKKQIQTPEAAKPPTPVQLQANKEFC